jgi:thiosulfate dehydrogenase [quinone] large subunit
MNIEKIVWLKLRIVMALIFLWAFFDKLLGLGFATSSQNAWINGGSPTYGFLTHATKGPFVEIFQSIAGNLIVDWMFMLGLLFVGTTLLVNRYVVLGSIAGVTMMMLMWLAVLPPENNPLLDDHIVYALVLMLLAFEHKRKALLIK